MVTYENRFTNKGAETTVRLGNRIVGAIHKVRNGYQYKPKGSKDGGEVFPHLHLVKRSLEQ